MRLPSDTKNWRYTYHKFFLVTLLFTLLVSCSDSSTSSEDPDSNGNGEIPQTENFTAEPGDRTTYISSSVSQTSLVDSNEETHTYTFRRDALENEGISFEAGDILLIEGLALRKVRTVTDSGGNVTLETDFATLNEAFRNADIDHAMSIDFTENIAEKIALEYEGRLLKAKSDEDGTGGEWKYELGDVTVEGALSAKASSAAIQLLVKYDTGDVSGAMITTATISNLRTETGVRIEDHETKHFSFNNPGLRGDIELEFVMAGGNSEEFNYAPPMPAIVVPFTIGPIPALLRIGTAFVFKLDLGATGSATYETSFSFDGDMGFRVEGSEFTPVLSGGLRDPSASSAEGNAAGFGGTVAGQYGIAVPDISLSMFGNAVVPYLRSEFYIGASYTFPTCSKLFSRYELKAGVDMNFFGMANLNINNQLAETSPHDYESDGCSAKLADEMLRMVSLDDPDSNTHDQPLIFRIQ